MRNGGYSLVESMVVLGVAGVLVSLAMPSLRDFNANERLVTRANETIALLNAARLHAVMARVHTVACPSLDGETCLAGTDWSRGHVVFEDRDNDRARDAGEAVVRSRIHGDAGIGVQSSRPLVAYRPSGRADGTNLSIRLCVGGPRQSRTVYVNNAGRARLAKSAPCES